jgi:hypothetical protein
MPAISTAVKGLGMAGRAFRYHTGGFKGNLFVALRAGKSAGTGDVATLVGVVQFGIYFQCRQFHPGFVGNA